jgi:hypothetical protein
VNWRLVPRESLQRSDRDAMRLLLSAHFDGVTRETFERDLDEKNWIVLFEETSRLRGFTTLLTYETTYREEPISVVYSGDTIMARDAWSTALLPRAWIAAVRSIREQHLRMGRLYWLLLTSGVRTYRLLPVFWKEFYPRGDASTPSDVESLLAHLAVERFGDCYRRDRGLVQFAAPQRLRDEGAPGVAGGRHEPHVEFFHRANPGWREGDELVCLTEITFDNLTAAGRRMWRAHKPDVMCVEPAV